MKEDLRDLPLFKWMPPTQFIPYPLDRQIGKIRDVARKLADKPTEKTAANYRTLITDNIRRKLTEYDVPESRQDDQVASFWRAVDLEIARLNHRSKKPNGVA